MVTLVTPGTAIKGRQVPSWSKVPGPILNKDHPSTLNPKPNGTTTLNPKPLLWHIYSKPFLGGAIAMLRSTWRAFEHVKSLGTPPEVCAQRPMGESAGHHPLQLGFAGKV